MRVVSAGLGHLLCRLSLEKHDGNVRWRKLLYAMNLRLIKKIRQESSVKDKPVCLIIDDTDAPKSGKYLIVSIWGNFTQWREH